MTTMTTGGGRFLPGILTLAFLLTAGASNAAPAAAFQGADGEPDQVERAMTLEARADDLMENRREWRTAARHLRQAADLRGEGDAQAISNLMTGARLAFYAGDGRAALGDLKQAGEWALAMGDVNTAAHAFLDAAWMGMQLSRPDVVAEYTHRAELLSRSPLLEAEERYAIHQRLEVPA